MCELNLYPYRMFWYPWLIPRIFETERVLLYRALAWQPRGCTVL
jgi:hypothetical protein